MKTIGLIGGMSWESTTLYYQVMNRAVATRLGGLHSAPLHMISLNFQDISARQRAGDWDGMGGILVESAQRLERSGADCVLIGTNTMHRLADRVQNAIDVPLLHIADVTADSIRAAGLDRIGLLGTLFTMEQSFYVKRLAARGIECLVPEAEDRQEVHRIIFEELCKGVNSAASLQRLRKICAGLLGRGAQGIVLGCTELPLLLGSQDVDAPVFNTTELHALAAVDFALNSGS